MKKLVILLLALCTLAIMALPASADYEYESKYLWYKPTDAFYWDNYGALYEHHQLMGYGKAEFDIENLINSELGASYVKYMKYFIEGYDQMDEEVLAYWESLGIKKELHDGEDADRHWTSYTPLEAYEAENADKKYPLLIVHHGNNNPLFVCESYGFAQLAAQEGFICVMPWAKNGSIVAEEVERIFAYLKENYPIDESRIYTAGFSLGGRTVVSEALRTPGRYAAINPGGMHLAGVRNVADFFADELWAAMPETGVIQIAGTMEMNLKLPYGIQGDVQIRAINKWFEINGIDRTVTQEYCDNLVATSENIIQKKLGLEFDAQTIQNFDGTEYYTGDFLTEEGVNIMRVVGIEGGIHWPTASFAKVSWDYMSQFSRDLESGELIYTPAE